MRTTVTRRGTTGPSKDPWPAWRTWTIRVWYGLLTLWVLAVARGAALVALGQVAPGESFVNATPTAWKLLAVGAVIVICVTGGRSVVAFHTVVVGSLAWILTEMLVPVQPADATPLASGIGLIVVYLAPLVALRPHRRQLLHLNAEPSPILLLLALVAAIPLAVYAVRYSALVPELGSPAYDLTDMGAVLAVQAIFSALRPGKSRWLPRLVAVAAAWVGLAAMLWPDDVGSFGFAGGAAHIGWACLYAGASELEVRRYARAA